MTQFISKADLETEIDKLDNQDFYVIDDLSGRTAYLKAIEDFYRILDNIKVKEIDLDYLREELDKVVEIYKPNGDFGWGTLYNIALHFFELGIKMKQEGE